MKTTILEDHATHVEAWRTWRANNLQNSLLEFYRALGIAYDNPGNGVADQRARLVASLNAVSDMIDFTGVGSSGLFLRPQNCACWHAGRVGQRLLV